MYIFITPNAALKEWHDNNLHWQPLEYGGVDRLYVPSHLLWLPDIVLYNKYVYITQCRSVNSACRGMTFDVLVDSWT